MTDRPENHRPDHAALASKLDQARVALSSVRALALIGAEHPQFTITRYGEVWTGNQVLDYIDKVLKETVP